MSRKHKFYAVANGRNPGFYPTYQACLEQIERYPDAFFKSFQSEDEAHAWLEILTPLSRELVLPCLVVGSQADWNRPASRCQVVRLPSETVYHDSYISNLSAVHLYEFLVIVDLLKSQHESGELIPVYTANTAVLHWIANAGQNSSLLNNPNCEETLRNAAQTADAWLIQHPDCRGIGLWNRSQWGEPPVFGDKANVAA